MLAFSNKYVFRFVLMGLAMGIVPFLPATNLFFRVGFVIAERVLYLPVVGVCILVVTGMRELCLAGHLGRVRVWLLFLWIYFMRAANNFTK